MSSSPPTPIRKHLSDSVSADDKKQQQQQQQHHGNSIANSISNRIRASSSGFLDMIDMSGGSSNPSPRNDNDRGGAHGGKNETWTDLNFDVSRNAAPRASSMIHEDSFYDEEDDEVYDADGTTPSANPATTVLQFDLCGSMWKRRTGLGRNAEKSWVMRSFTLNGPILCYHEEPTLASVADPTKPRARLNLSKTETIAEMHSKSKPGLPTSDLLTINIYDPIIHSKRKWEMCCTSKEQQLVWYKAINVYNGKPEGSPQIGNLNLLQQLSHNNEPGLTVSTRPTSPPPRYQMPYLSNDGGSIDNGTRIIRMSPSKDGAGGTLDDAELIAKAAAKAAEIMSERQQSNLMKGVSSYHALLGMAVVNAAIYTARYGTEQSYKLAVFLVNVAMLYMVSHQFASSGSGKAKRGPKARAAKSSTKHQPSAPSTPEQMTPNNHQQPPHSKNFAKVIPVGQTISRASPVKNSELDKQLQLHPHNSLEALRAYADATTSSLQVQPHTYGNVDAPLFKLRIGPNYKRNKQKAPSGPALYDLITMDFLYADAPLKSVSDKFQLPNIPGLTDVSTGHAHIPPVLVINTWLPGEEPSMFSGKGDAVSETYSIPMVFALSRDTLEQLKDLESASPGVKLLSEWCKRGEKDSDFRGRFKCMGMIENIESTGVPKFIQGYNGKPALVTKSGTFTRHANYIEFTINVNMWAYLARKGLHTLTPTFPEFIFNVGFTIEARKDEEMPEVLLGGCRLLNLDPEKAVIDGVDDVDI